MAAILMDRCFKSDIFCGKHRIRGTVTRLGLVGRYRIDLFDRQFRVIIRETYSLPDGTYVFPYILDKTNGYFAIAFDDGAAPLNAAIADLVTPEPMQ